MEREHKGSEYSSVFYIPSGPDCAINRDYLRRMRHTFMLGQSPPDFPTNNYEINFSDRANLKHVSEIGRQMMGFDPQLKLQDEREGTCSS